MADPDHAPLPPGWSRIYSNSQKRNYFFHEKTKHTQWHFPTASEAADPGKAKKRAEMNNQKEKKRLSEGGGDDAKRTAKRQRTEETAAPATLTTKVAAATHL